MNFRNSFQMISGTVISFIPGQKFLKYITVQQYNFNLVYSIFKMNSLKCRNCEKKLIKNCRVLKVKPNIIRLNDDLIIARQIFCNDLIRAGDVFCTKCRRKISSVKSSSKKSSPVEENQSCSSSSIVSPSSSTYSKYTEPESNTSTTPVVEIEIPSCTYSQKSCIVCHQSDKRNRLSDEIRLNVYLTYNFYIPKGVRCCPDHYLNNTLYDEAFNRIITVSNVSLIPVNDFQWLVQEATKRKTPSNLLDSFTNKRVTEKICASITGLSKDNFFDLNSKLKSLKTTQIRSKEAALVVFLMKLKSALSYDALSSLFSFRNLQQIERICNDVQAAFEVDIIPYSIGTSSLSRELLLERQAKLAKLLLPNSELILIADSTYAYHDKSKNNSYQRKSYSMHKHDNLCKPFTVCTTDGYIVDVFGPYLGTSNDATILNDVLMTDSGLRSILKPNDCFVVDRGFRDVVKKVKSLGYDIKMPSLKMSGSQLSTAEANASRMVTKIRWVVECVHGILKMKWKSLNTFKNQSLAKVKPLFSIAGSLHNLYGKKLLCDVGREEEVAEKIMERQSIENVLHDYVLTNSLDKIRKNL